MRTICSWCRRTIRIVCPGCRTDLTRVQAAREDYFICNTGAPITYTLKAVTGFPISHGICDGCSELTIEQRDALARSARNGAR